KATPMLPGFVVPTHCRIRRDKVDITGVVTLRHNSRLHHIGLGRGLTGTRVLALVADLEVRVLTEDGELLRAFNLDPSRDPHCARSGSGTCSTRKRRATDCPTAAHATASSSRRSTTRLPTRVQQS